MGSFGGGDPGGGWGSFGGVMGGGGRNWGNMASGAGTILSGVANAFGGGQSGGGMNFNRTEAANRRIDLGNQFKMDLAQQQQFKPLAPFGTAARAQLLGGIVKAWGLDTLLGDKFTKVIGDLTSAKIPGYDAPNITPQFDEYKSHGLPWKKILATVGAGVATAFTGGAAAPLLGGALGIGAGSAAALAGATAGGLGAYGASR